MTNQTIQTGGDHVDNLAPVFSIAPLQMAVDERPRALELRVSAPVKGEKLPIIIFSHGNGQSLYAYGPLANFWAAQGFVVIQPTHLDSRMVNLAADDPERAQLWRHREHDLVTVLDGLDWIETAVPEIRRRLDRERISVAGHSWGAQTASMLLGATHPDPDNDSTVDIRDKRIKAGVLLCVPGTGGANLSRFAADNFPFMHPDFSAMAAPALIVAGDADKGAMTVRGPDWWRDAYDLSPASKSLFTAFGGEHSLGGIPNYEARETTDESPRRVAAIQQLSSAYLKTVFGLDESAWDKAVASVTGAVRPEGDIVSK